MGSFADNMGSFMTGLTGKILQEKETQDQITRDNDKAALQMKMNLFGTMLGDPDKFSANDLKLMGSTILKDHKLDKAFPGAEDYLGKLIQGRENDVKTWGQNKDLQDLGLGDPSSWSPLLYRAGVGSVHQEQKAREIALQKYKYDSLIKGQENEQAIRLEGVKGLTDLTKAREGYDSAEAIGNATRSVDLEKAKNINTTNLEVAKIRASAPRSSKAMTDLQRKEATISSEMRAWITANPSADARAIFNHRRMLEDAITLGKYPEFKDITGAEPPMGLLEGEDATPSDYLHKTPTPTVTPTTINPTFRSLSSTTIPSKRIGSLKDIVNEIPNSILQAPEGKKNEVFSAWIRGKYWEQFGMLSDKQIV